jgi:phospholipid/cholesterol/gamma-HCH transport system substrate-binding protein
VEADVLTRFVRIQLAIFAVVSLIGVVVITIVYIQAPTLLGVGRIRVTLELPDTGGLYQFANVTYRGVQIGKVTDMGVNRDGATATLTLDTTPPIPADLQAEVRSVSAVGEQYVDLRPRDGFGPYLRDGSVIPRSETTIPQAVSPMMERLNGLVKSIPRDQLKALLGESFTAFNGAGPDLRSLVDSTSRLSADLNGAAGDTAQLMEDAAPVLDGQQRSGDDLRTWTSSLAGVTDQLVTNDPQIRHVLQAAPDAAQQVSLLLNQVKPTLPVLLANLTTLGQVAVTYHPSLEQLLVLLPPTAAYYQAENGSQNATGIPVGDFRISIADPPACTVGFLPPSSWRSPADTTTVDTPDGLYCKLPQDSPIAVRGARNSPCMGVPGKYAPTVQECYSDKPYQPLAMRQNALGPYPIDPNLIAQGIPPDSRVTRNDHIFAPVEGTPGPPDQTPVPPPPDQTPAAPSGLTVTSAGGGPSVAVAHYDPRTGRYATPDGAVYAQPDLVKPAGNWRGLVLAGAA